ncbi:MAG: phenylalanine--tRNA ligase subunit beta [Firmicutes bacterium]|nr:phenylalanine--tRNA ligase subunit beta [Bacillota bacterium]
MQVPYQWLKEYIDPGMSAQQLADLMTLSGIEVGAVERFGPELPGVVVGQAKKVEQHPGRSNLTLVEVDTGGDILNIVCGAHNVKVGDKVPVARPGSKLPGERLIEETKLYGVLSSGMLCSAQELGLELGAEDEILILEEDAPLGVPVDRLLGFDDQILFLELTPNRSDCLGLIGVAHEVAALTGAQVVFPPCEPVESGRQLHDFIQVTVKDSEWCPRYTARVVVEITIKKSPLWMQLRLLKAGIRPISNVVDITNYVMWEYGQPLHAFDLELLTDSEIIVRRATAGEVLITLDGVKRELDTEVLVIADSTKAVGLAGVMGGENTEITETTKAILIEAAAFNPKNIRRTARRFALPSEASQRFEKGVNHDAVLDAQNRAAYLIGELTGGKVLQGLIDINSSMVKPWPVQLKPSRVNKILGMEIAQEEIIAILSKLGLPLKQVDEDQLLVTVPLRRPDLIIEEDLIEEIVRLHGYDRVPTTLPRGELTQNRESMPERLKTMVRNLLVSCGFYECITYSFINPANLNRLRIAGDDPRLRLISVQNPFSEEQAVMRTTLLPGLLKAALQNISYRELNMQLFELGIVYYPQKLPIISLPEETERLTLLVSGLAPEPNWVVPSRQAGFYEIKGALELIFKRFQIEGVNYLDRAEPFTHPTRSAQLLLDGKLFGFIGELHPDVAVDFGLEQPVTIAEIELAPLFSKANLVPRMVPLPRYPAANRDLAVVVSKEVCAAKLEEAIWAAGGELLDAVRLFDLYEGKQVPAGKRSLAYSLVFRTDEGTLTEAEVNAAQNKIEEALLGLGATLRS